MQRSPSTPSESFEEELLEEVARQVYLTYGVQDLNDARESATEILKYLRSKGVINNG